MSNLSAGENAGIAIGAIVAALLAIYVLYRVFRRHTGPGQSHTESTGSGQSHTESELPVHRVLHRNGEKHIQRFDRVYGKGAYEHLSERDQANVEDHGTIFDL
jgi:hypothetical protein